MDGFEQIIAGLLRQEGYWTITDYKVDLSKAKKAELAKPSMPRPELDILAYKAATNTLLWVECKSFLNSSGVRLSYFTDPASENAARYKIFTWPLYRELVTEELINQTTNCGLVQPNPRIRYCLAAGRIATHKDRIGLHEHFRENEWILYDELWIRERLAKYANIGYEDDIAILVAKLFTGKCSIG